MLSSSVRPLLRAPRALIYSQTRVYSDKPVIPNQGEATGVGYPIQRELDTFQRADNKVEYLTTRVDDVLNYCRSNSMWPLTFGLACCAIFEGGLKFIGLESPVSSLLRLFFDPLSPWR